MSNSDLLDAVRAYVAAIAPGHAATWVSIELDNDRARVVSLPVTPATKAPSPGVPDSFIPSQTQELILDALAGKALRTDQIANLCDIDRRTLFKPGGLKELQDVGLVAWHRRLGYYRPDDPPPDA